MKTITQIFNETLGAKALVNGSLYYEQENKVVRFANHAAKVYNVEINNPEIEEMLLVFVNAGMTEQEMQDNVDEIAERMDIFVDYSFYNDGENVSLTKDEIERFLN